MKRIFLTGLFLMLTLSSTLTKAEDSILLLTLKTEVNQTTLKNELRLGLWKEGKDGFDPLDTEAMLNGLFDAYFETPSPGGGSSHLLWWDIRSSNPSQEWILHIKSPSAVPLLMEWKQISPGEANPVHFVLIDPETGHETDLNPPGGFLQLSLRGSKTYIIKSLLK